MKHNDDLVLDIIKNNTKSLTAYEILSKVQRVKKNSTHVCLSLS